MWEEIKKGPISILNSSVNFLYVQTRAEKNSFHAFLRLLLLNDVSQNNLKHNSGSLFQSS